MTRPGIRRTRVRSPQLALAELRTLIPKQPPKSWTLRDWFYGCIRSFCARHMKAGL